MLLLAAHPPLQAPPAKRQARPSRAAKNAAAAAFVAMAAVSGGEEGGSDADMGEVDATSSDDRSVERRVGTEGRTRLGPEREKKTK